MGMPVPSADGPLHAHAPSGGVAAPRSDGDGRNAARADHVAWLAALASWREAIDRWQQEHGSATARLRSLQQAIEDHGRCLIDHRQSFERVADAVQEHERLLAAGGGADTLADRHQQCASLFAHLEEAQRRIARHHDEFMARMAALEEAAGAAL